MSGTGIDESGAGGDLWSQKLWSSIACIIRLGNPLTPLDQSVALLAAAAADPEAFARLHQGPFLFGELDRSSEGEVLDDDLHAFHRQAFGGRDQVYNLSGAARLAERAISRRLEAFHFLIELRSNRGLAEDSVTLGRHPDRDIVINDHRISALHAYFGELDGIWYVGDADSANGTFVGGAPLQGAAPCPLIPQISMRFGQRVFARYLELSDLLGIARVYRRRSKRGPRSS